jgi:membrane associated rhomboid family serine protease
MTISLIIIAITVAVSIYAFNNKEISYRFEFSPYQVVHFKQQYRLLSHALVHADWMHLLMNMYVLYFFGKFTEKAFIITHGAKGFLYYVLLYVGGVFVASLPALSKHKDNPQYRAIGASGAVSAVLFSSIMYMPLANIHFFFIPFGIPAFVFGGIYLAFEYYMDKRSNDFIAHDAHLWGAIFGVLFTVALSPSVLLNFFNQIMAW